MVLSGQATVLAPREVVVWPRMPTPEVSLQRHDRYAAVLGSARCCGPMRAAIVHPCSVESLSAALEARAGG